MSVSMQQINQEIARQDWNSAELHLKQGLQEHPDSAKGWYYLAQVEGKLNNYPAVKTALENADRIDPNHTYVGNLQIYNDLYAKAMTAQTFVTPSAPTYTATVQQPTPVYTSGKVDTDHSGMWTFLGVVILAIMGYVFWKQRKEDKKVNDRNSATLDALRASRSVTVPSSTSGASQSRLTLDDEVRAIRNTPATPVPPPVVRELRYVASPSPVPAPAPSSTRFVEGMIAGAALDEVVRSVAKDVEPKRSSSDDFDYSSVPSPPPAPSRSNFDYGSSPSPAPSPSYDWGSSGSSSSWSSGSSGFDSGSFDSGSSFSSDSSW